MIHGEHMRQPPIEERIKFMLGDSAGALLPKYADFTHLENNSIAKNNNAMPPVPFFGDEFDGLQAGLFTDLELHFKHQRVDPPVRRLQKEYSVAYLRHVPRLLEDWRISWNDVLFYLLDLGHVAPSLSWPPNAKQLWEDRKSYCDTMFDRHHQIWVDIREMLSDPTGESLAIAGLVCYAFKKVCGFSLWTVAARSPFVAQCCAALQIKKKAKEDETAASQKCLVCQM